MGQGYISRNVWDDVKATLSALPEKDDCTLQIGPVEKLLLHDSHFPALCMPLSTMQEQHIPQTIRTGLRPLLNHNMHCCNLQVPHTIAVSTLAAHSLCLVGQLPSPAVHQTLLGLSVLARHSLRPCKHSQTLSCNDISAKTPVREHSSCCWPGCGRGGVCGRAPAAVASLTNQADDGFQLGADLLHGGALHRQSLPALLYQPHHLCTHSQALVTPAAVEQY